MTYRPTDLLSLAQVAEELGVSRSTLHTQLARGSLVASKVGRDYVVMGAEVDRYRALHLGRRSGPSKARSSARG